MINLHETYWWFRGKKEIILYLIKKYHPQAQSVLDIGCGDGYFFHQYQGVGIEPCELFKKPNIINRPIEEVSLDEKFDVIICLDVLEHLENDAIIKRFLDQNLQKKGIAIISVPAHRKLFNQHDLANHHYRRYDKQDFVSLLQEYSPTVYYYNSLLYPIAYIIRKFSRGQDNLKPLPKILNELLFSIFRLEKYLLNYLKTGMSLLAIIKDDCKVRAVKEC